MDKEVFWQDLAPSNRKEFAKNYWRDEGEKLPPDGLWTLYEPYAQLANSVADEAHALEVLVIRNARLQDFSNAFLTRQAITLVAHWRSDLFRTDDLANIGGLTEEQHRSFAEATGFSCRNMKAEEIASRLNAFLQTGMDDLSKSLRPSTEWPACSSKVPAGALSRFVSALHQRRQLLEERLPGVFQGGSAVEFSEGQILLKEVAQSVPVSFAGTLDLTVCNSILLGDQIRNRCADCTVMMNAYETSFDFRFALYRQIVRSLDEKPEPFIRATMWVRNYLSKEFQCNDSNEC